MLWILGAALAADPVLMSGDEAAGYSAGRLDGAQVDCREWYAYGAGAGCLVGCTGCIGMTTAAYLVDPHAWDPVNGEAPDARHPESFPELPLRLEDPDAWRQGYEQGWDEEVQRARARNAFIGGSAPVAVYGAFVGLYMLAVVAVFTF